MHSIYDDRRFTTEQAFDAADCDEPIMLTRAAAMKICNDHSALWYEFLGDEMKWNETAPEPEMVAADRLLAWLGY